MESLSSSGGVLPTGTVRLDDHVSRFPRLLRAVEHTCLGRRDGSDTTRPTARSLAVGCASPAQALVRLHHVVEPDRGGRDGAARRRHADGRDGGRSLL